MDLQLAENLSDEIEQIGMKLDEIEDAGEVDFIPEKSPEWMATYREKIQLDAKFFLVANEGSEIQFNEEKTSFRVVTKENRGKKFW